LGLYFNTLRLTRKNRDDGKGQMFGHLFKNGWWHKGLDTVLILTGRCNLHCDYCPMFLDNNKYPKFEESTLEEWKEFFERFPEWISQIFISGGEPSLIPYVSDLANWLVERGHHVCILSNLYKVENLMGLKKHWRLVAFPTFHHSDDPERYKKAYEQLKTTGVRIYSQELEKKHKFQFSVHKNFYPADWFKYWNEIIHFAPNAPRTRRMYMGVYETYKEGK